MTRYYVLLLDELGEEFGVYIMAQDIDDAFEKVNKEYPESCVINIRKGN